MKHTAVTQDQTSRSISVKYEGGRAKEKKELPGAKGKKTQSPHLSPDKDVEAVAVLRVDRARHRVERPDFQWVLVHHKEVRTVLVGHQVAELFLVLRRQVTVDVSCQGPRQTEYTLHATGFRRKVANTWQCS